MSPGEKLVRNCDDCYLDWPIPGYVAVARSLATAPFQPEAQCCAPGQVLRACVACQVPQPLRSPGSAGCRGGCLPAPLPWYCPGRGAVGDSFFQASPPLWADAQPVNSQISVYFGEFRKMVGRTEHMTGREIARSCRSWPLLFYSLTLFLLFVVLSIMEGNIWTPVTANQICMHIADN